jgi:hypothetical protein
MTEYDARPPIPPVAPTADDIGGNFPLYPDRVAGPLLFLDIDGVMNSSRCDNWLYRHKIDNFRKLYFDPVAVAALNQVVHDTHAEIVLSSSWRISHGFEWIKGHFMKQGFAYPWNIVGTTCGRFDGNRGMQILDWIGRTGYTGEYAVVDDSSQGLADNALIYRRFVKTTTKNGLTPFEAYELVDILMGRMEKIFRPGDVVDYRGMRHSVVGVTAKRVTISLPDGSESMVSRKNISHMVEA